MIVKETYHADCLRIKQLENQIEGYKGENGEQFERIEELEKQLARRNDLLKEIYEKLYFEPDYIKVDEIVKKIKEFESEQND